MISSNAALMCVWVPTLQTLSMPSVSLLSIIIKGKHTCNKVASKISTYTCMHMQDVQQYTGQTLYYTAASLLLSLFFPVPRFMHLESI